MRLKDEFEPLPGYISTTDFAKQKGVDRNTVIRWAWEEKIKGYQIAGVIVIPIAELFKVGTERKKEKNLESD